MEHGTLRPVPKSRVRRARARWNRDPRGRVFFFKKKKNKRTHKGTGTLVVHTCTVEPHDGAGPSTHFLTHLDHSVFNSEPGKCPHRAGSETREINEMDRAGPVPGSQTATFFFFFAKTKLSHDGPLHGFEPNETVQNNTKDNEFSWGRGHVHPCCCLRFCQQATASLPS